MIVQYQNTLEEFIEASRALAAHRREKRSGKRGVATTVMSLFFFAAYWLLLAVPHSNHFVVVFHLFMPIVLSGTIVVIFLLATSLARGKMPQIGLRSILSLAMLLLIVGGIVGLYFLDISLHPRAARIQWDWALFLPHITWLFFVVWITVFVITRQRKEHQTSWDEQLTLHRAKTADISAEGVAITDAFSRTEFRWQAFVGWQETSSLIVLFPSERSVLFFPKSAFASPEELDAMRSLAGLILAVPGTAFPVVPLETAPPVSVTK